MKKYLLISVIIILVVLDAYAQCSNPYYQLHEGTLIEIENYDAKGKAEGKTEIRVIDWNETTAGFKATIGYKIFDKKGKQAYEGDYTLECIDGAIHIDMSAFVPDESMQAFKDMELEMKMDQLEYPVELREGQILEDATFEMTAKNSPMPMNFTFIITDRKVEGKESVTTPAGTFDCFKISHTTNSKMMIANSNFRTVQYITEKYGAVKTETYRSNGKLVGYSLLNKFEE
jgi:hypothetical protein